MPRECDEIYVPLVNEVGRPNRARASNELKSHKNCRVIADPEARSAHHSIESTENNLGKISGR